MSRIDAKRKRIRDEYEALRDHDPYEYEKCSAFASYVAFQFETGAGIEMKVADEVETRLMSYALRAVKAEVEIAELRAALKAKSKGTSND